MKLLEEIQAMRTEPGELMICWLGQAGVCLKDAEGRIVYVDPYFTIAVKECRASAAFSAADRSDRGDGGVLYHDAHPL